MCFIFFIKNCNLLIPMLPLRTSKLQVKPSALKREQQEIFYFLQFLWVIFALLDPDSDAESGSGSTD
jgi:hypothetical protein